MKTVHRVDFKVGSKEEILPDFEAAFPLITSCYPLTEGYGAPWHWHNTVEIFYMDGGTLEYDTPSTHYVFPPGSGGFVNSDVLHSTFCTQTFHDGRQLLHIFDPALIAGTPGSRIEKRYILPITTAPQIELIPLFPENPKERELLDLLRRSLALSPTEQGYELYLRALLSELWLGLYDLAVPTSNETISVPTQCLKDMLVYIHGHYTEPLTVAEIAAATHVSSRSCYNLFQKHLSTTPMAYTTSYRLQIAAKMLRETNDTTARIAEVCALGSASNLSKLFRRAMGITPRQYRKQERNSSQ